MFSKNKTTKLSPHPLNKPYDQKMKTSTLNRSLFFILLFSFFVAFQSLAQFTFTSSSALSTATHSGCAMTIVDVNNDGLDDVVKMDQSTTLMVDLQNKNGTFTHYNLGNISGTSRVWGMAAADVDHNGWKDVATGTGSAMYIVKLSWTGSTIAAATTTLTGSYLVQNVTFGDFNNDGWADLFVCDDNDYAKVYKNDGTGTLTQTTTLINTNINPGMTYSGGDPYDSGNYGSVWTDFDNDGDLDLFIAHCRLGVTSNTDQRRRDRLFVNNGSNVYTEMAQSYGIETTDFKETWTSSFGDIDNDGDLDLIETNHSDVSLVLLNDGTGHYTDITASTNFSLSYSSLESVLEDFDNDGYLDLLVSGYNHSGTSLFHNNGNNTFTEVANPFGGTTFLSFATGDLNHDGKIDVITSYGGGYNTPSGSTADALYMNTTKNSYHFITFDLKGTQSNLGAIGARVTLYGPWGKQIREVRAGESYGTSNSMQLHFGLGQHTTVDSAHIDWPSHLQTRFANLAADQFVTAVEAGCTLTGNVIPGPFGLCTGQTLPLATGGFSSYNWSTGETSSSIIVSSTGFYNVSVIAANGCSNISPSVDVELNPDETPTINTSGHLEFCGGGSVTLTATQAASYAWNSGETTQAIVATASGKYAVTIQGLCVSFTSDSTEVNVLPDPPPFAPDVTSPGPAAVTLNATGNFVSWYDQQTGGTLQYTGLSFTTPVLFNTTTYWAENATSYGGSSEFAGQPYHSGGNLYNNGVNGGLDFNVTSACMLASVKIYTESTHYGTREIQILNSVGTVIRSLVVNLSADTTVVPLNFSLAVGTGYRITTNGTLDNTNFGAASPFMQRSNSGVGYPYIQSGKVTITNGWTGSATSSSAYYYFYDWNIVVPPTVCVSERVPVQAIIIIPTGVNNISADNHFHVYPNPAGENVTVSFDLADATTSKVEFIDAVGRVVSSDVIENTGGNYSREFSVSKFAKGLYTIHVSSKDKTSYQKLVIQ